MHLDMAEESQPFDSVQIFKERNNCQSHSVIDISGDSHLDKLQEPDVPSTQTNDGQISTSDKNEDNSTLRLCYHEIKNKTKNGPLEAVPCLPDIKISSVELEESAFASSLIGETRSKSDDLPPLNHVTKHYSSSQTSLIDPPPSESSHLTSLIPSIKIKAARARSYLVGRILAMGSLLGEEELSRYFPDRTMTIFVGTWNMNSQLPEGEIDDFLLPESLEYVPDLYAIGIQEGFPDKHEWEVVVQTTVGPSHILLHSVTLGSLHLAIFLRRDLIWFCSEVEDTTISTRPSSLFRTKGAVALCFYFFGTLLLFINTHLPAHEDKFQERIEDFRKIVQALDLPKSLPVRKTNSSLRDPTEKFDCIFWMGDLNFRLIHDREQVVSIVKSFEVQEDPSYELLLRHDQLLGAINNGLVFSGFQEAPITFGPTYKFSIGTNTFDKETLRVPSYTDRILYKSHSKSSVECTHYKMVPSIDSSDHKPVFATFKVPLKPGNDNLPLAAGHFNRAVYLEALERRSKALQPKSSDFYSSSICSVS